MSESGIAIDSATVGQELLNHEELESVGGLAYLVSLAGVSQASRRRHRLSTTGGGGFRLRSCRYPGR
jgi:hypothetical protein